MRQLTAAFVRTVTLPGKYGDQHGLILRVTPSGSKQWIWRGTIRGRRRDLGLGGYPYTSLAEARQTASSTANSPAKVATRQLCVTTPPRRASPRRASR